MKLYFVRHGETDMNARNMFYGWYDADINEKGVSQAEELREAFREIHIDKIYSSDLTRALHTAQIIADGRPVEIVPDLREMAYGIWENRTWESMTESDRELLKKWRYDWTNLEIPEGETFMGFYDRVTSGLDKIIKENKAYAVLRQEGFIRMDRRSGAVIAVDVNKMAALEDLKEQMKVLLAKARCKNISKEEVYSIVDEIFNEYL